MSSLTDRLNQLRQRATEVAANIAALTAKRKEQALDAMSGDKSALQIIASVDHETDILRREAFTLDAAISTAQEMQRQEAVDLEQQEHRERDHNAYTTARAIIALQLELDDLMQQLSALCERRASLLRELGQTFDPSFASRLSGRGPLTRSACHYGLHRFLAIETCAPSSMRPLADTHSLLLGVGKAADDKARVKFRGDA
jgi:hypothetical protein